MSDTSILITVAVLGGTGNVGKGLAYRLAKSGYHVVIGSRSSEKAEVAAQEIANLLGKEASLIGNVNLTAAQSADIVLITVPYSAHASTIESVKEALDGKILIDVTVPLTPPEVTKVYIPPSGSAAQEALAILGSKAEVATAYQNISAEHLLSDDPAPCEVLVCGTSQTTRAEVIKLVEATGFSAWDAGPIENAVVIEGLTPILIGINKTYKIKHSGIRITGR